MAETSEQKIPVVAVVMSTYNGEKYLSEQIDSILTQKDVHVELFVRDDGSTDTTRDIISNFMEKNKNIHADFGENLGWAKSFLTELFSVPSFEYYAFSDQDDVWKPEKLIAGIKAIRHEEEQHGKNFPVVWHSSFIFADSNLNVMFVRHMEKRRATLESFMIKQHGRGCAMVFNAGVRNIMEEINHVGFLNMSHDLMAIVVSYAFGGELIFSPGAYIFYRQHTDNVSNMPVGIVRRLIAEIKIMRETSEGLGTIIAREMLRACGNEVTPSARKTFALVAEHKNNFMSRLKIIFSPKFRAGDLRLTLFGKFKALFGLL